MRARRFVWVYLLYPLLQIYRLPARKLLPLFTAAGWLLWIEMRFRLGFRTALRLESPPLLRRRRPPPFSSLRPSPEEIQWATEAASRWIPGSRNCLRQALVAEALLRHFGYSALLQIGVRRDAWGSVEGHAWVQWNDRVLVGNLRLEEYVMMTPPCSSAL